jgi:hypothetical protein
VTAATSDFVDEIVLSDEYDARGQHDDAIDMLARATKRGDIEATTRLGKRLLVGDRAPHLAAEGARFLFDAAKLGGAEAASRMAVLVGTGAFFKQDWNGALNLLLTAAERGWRPAQDQIRVLAEDRDLADSATGSGRTADIWRRLAMTIDFPYWNSTPQGITLNEAPLVRSFPDLIPGRVCNWFVERARPKLERAQVYDAQTGHDTIHSTRTNTAASFDMLQTDMVMLLVQNRMVAASGIPLSHFEASTVLHYGLGEEITDHFDFVDPRTPNYMSAIKKYGQRVMTFLIYLNDDYEGGETEFPKLDLSHKGRLGEGTYFINAHPDGQPDLRTVHAGRPPAQGEKWIFSQFIRDRPVLTSTPVP